MANTMIIDEHQIRREHDEKTVHRDCINWSNGDHCAKFKCNHCTNDCKDFLKVR